MIPPRKWQKILLLCLAALSLSFYAMWSAKFQFLRVESTRQAIVHLNRTFSNVTLPRVREVEMNKSYTSMERRQLEEKRRLADYCHTNPHKSLDMSQPLGRFQVIESPRIMYCMMPKVASRQWRSTLQKLRSLRHQARITLPQYNAKDRSDYFSRSYKFMFIREPFERLLSAYKEKFIERRKEARPFLERIGRKIIPKFRPNATQHALQALDDITFPEFIEYILKDGVQDGLDEHWNTYDDQCIPCEVDFNFIGRYEFLSEDANYMLREVGIYNLTTFPAVKYSNTRRELLKYYSQIPLEWILQLGRIYRKNFEMFGYPFPGPLEALFHNTTGTNLSTS